MYVGVYGLREEENEGCVQDDNGGEQVGVGRVLSGGLDGAFLNQQVKWTPVRRAIGQGRVGISVLMPRLNTTLLTVILTRVIRVQHQR
jgi:hypothetical protein